jgi:hypothetical protein
MWKKFVHIVFEKYGIAKIFGGAILGLFFYWLYDVTYIEFWKWVSIPFGGFAILSILGIVYAWIINPIRGLVLWIKTKKGQGSEEEK